MKKILLLCAMVTGLLWIHSSGVFAQEDSNRQKLNRMITSEIERIERSSKEMPQFASPVIRMTREQWERLAAEELKKLGNLRALVEQTPEEQIPDVLVDQFLENNKDRDQYPSLDTYLIVLGEATIDPISQRFDKADPSNKEQMLVILGNTYSRKALPVVKNALDDANLRVGLYAQTTLRLLLGLEAKPELFKMLVDTRSSWGLRYTLRELSIIADQDWYREFFRLVRDNKLALYDLSFINHQGDIPEEVVAENLDYLLEVFLEESNPRFNPSDIEPADKFQMLFNDDAEGQNVLKGIVRSNFDPRALTALISRGDTTELTGEDQSAVVAALNKTIEDPELFLEHAGQWELKDPVLKDMFNQLVQRGVFLEASPGVWALKSPLSPAERREVLWFNVHLLVQEFPTMVYKDRRRAGDKNMARRMILKLTDRNALVRLYPLLPDIVRERYGQGGKVDGFSSRVNQAPDPRVGFNEHEADLLLGKLFGALEAAVIREWLEQNPSDFLTRIFLQEMLALKTKEGAGIQVGELFFRITVKDGLGDHLASAEFQLRHGIEQTVVLKSAHDRFVDHSIKLKVQIDRANWMFRIDPILIDLKPHAAMFGVFVPVGGVNETPLIETLSGKRETLIWVFEHLLK